MPDEFASARQQLLAQLGVTATVGDVPLTGGDDLERLVSLFEELHRMRDRPWVAVDVPGLAEDLHHPLLGGVGGGPGNPLVERGGVGRRDPRGRFSDHATVPADDRPGGKLQLPPPGDVGEITERTDHRDSRAFLGIGERMRDDRHLHIERWCSHRAAEQWLVALVVGVRHEGDACGE